MWLEIITLEENYLINLDNALIIVPYQLEKPELEFDPEIKYGESDIELHKMEFESSMEDYNDAIKAGRVDGTKISMIEWDLYLYGQDYNAFRSLLFETKGTSFSLTINDISFEYKVQVDTDSRLRGISSMIQDIGYTITGKFPSTTMF